MSRSRVPETPRRCSVAAPEIGDIAVGSRSSIKMPKKSKKPNRYELPTSQSSHTSDQRREQESAESASPTKGRKTMLELSLSAQAIGL
jgi:hypothetical protein